MSWTAASRGWSRAGRALPPQWVGLKFFNVYGPNEYHKGAMQSVIARNFAAVRDGEPMRLFRSYRPALCRRRPAARLHLRAGLRRRDPVAAGASRRSPGCSMSAPARRAAGWIWPQRCCVPAAASARWSSSICRQR